MKYMKGIKRIICSLLAIIFVFGMMPVDAVVHASGSGLLGEAVLTGNRDFKWPVPDFHNISACFYDGRNHYAIDIGTMTTNADIVASYDGEVVEITLNGVNDYGYGNAVMLKHTYPAKTGTVTLYTRYAHMDEISADISVGTKVVGGVTVLGTTGGTGYGSASYYQDHLDFQILTSSDWLNRQTCSIDPFANNLMELPADLYLGRASDCCQSYIDEIKALYASGAHTHSYEKTVTPPTCTVDGYTTYTCSCGDKYTDDEVTAPGHSYGADGACTVCGEVEQIEKGKCGDNVTYILDKNGVLTISGNGGMYDCQYLSYGGDIHIVRGWDGRRDNVKKVVIEEGVSSIGENSFRLLPNLESVEIADSVSYIGNRAFANSRSLKDVSFGTGLQSTGVEVFSDCDSIERVVLPNADVDYGNHFFVHCDGIKEIVFPEKLTAIGGSMFEDCTGLTEVIIPHTITTIGGGAFKGCCNLEVVEIPNSVTKIGAEAFSNCGMLKEVTIPGSVISIGYSAFSNCGNLTKVTLSEGLQEMSYGIFELSNKLKEIVVPSTVVKLSHTFRRAYGLESVKFLGHAPNAIGADLFSDISVKAYYPANDSTWTQVVMGNYGGNVTWIPYTHEHVYSDVITNPTCTEDGYTTHSCYCGDIYTDSYVNAKGHTWDVTDCTATKVCTVCGESRSADAGHDWQNGMCGAPKTCSICKVTEGTIEHKEVNGVCSICGAISVSEENFPDAAFREYVSKNINGASDGWLTGEELKAVTNITIGNSNVSSLKGIEHFTALEILYCKENANLTSLDLSKNTELHMLDCGSTPLTTLDLSKNTKLRTLYCHKTQLTSLDLSNNTELYELGCGATPLTTLDLSKNTKLGNLQCGNGQLTSIDLSGCKQLQTIVCNGNLLTNLDLSGKSRLRVVGCHSNSLVSLNLSGCSSVENVFCGSNQLTNLVLDGCTELTVIDCKDNQLTELDTKDCINLSTLNCSSNYLEKLDFSSNTELYDLNCEDNYLTSLDLSKCTALRVLWCTLNELESLDLSKNTELSTLYCGYNYLTSLDLSNCVKLSTLDPQYNIRVVTGEQNKFDLSTLPGFDVSKVVEVIGGTIEGNILTAEEMAVGYYYDCGLGVAIGFVLVFENLCEHEWIEASCTEDKICYICGANGGEALGHDMGDWVTTDEPTCTEDGSKRRECSRCDHFETDAIPALGHDHDTVVTPPTCTEEGYTTYICACGDTYIDDEVDALGHDMSEWETTDEPTCTADGSKRRECSRCDHFETDVIPACHDMGDWYTVTEATLEADGEDRRDCSRCDHFETRVTRFVDGMLKLEGEDFLDRTTVYINGLPYPVVASGDERYVELPSEEDCSIVTYDYHVGDPDDIHTKYPVGMKVYMVSDGEITYIEEFDNLLQYSGASIRISGNKGIRMITSLYKDAKSALTGKGLAGYKLVEYGTVLAFSSEVEGDGDLVLGKSYSRSNYAYKRGVADPVFANSGNLTQYTNVLVGFSLDQCKEDIAMRPYIILENAEGEQFTVYGGTIHRSIGYVAYQNRNIFKAGTDAYTFVWDVIHHVYGDQYDSEYKG